MKKDDDELFCVVGGWALVYAGLVLVLLAVQLGLVFVSVLGVGASIVGVILLVHSFIVYQWGYVREILASTYKLFRHQ